MMRRDRSAGQAAAGFAVAVGVASAVVGVGVPAAAPHVRHFTAWLSNDNGSVTRVDGLAGRADATVPLPDSAGHRLKVVQDDSTVIVDDLTTGAVTSIAPAQLAVSQSVNFGTAGTLVVTGPGATYLADPVHGTVVRIDPTQLTTIGTPLAVGGGAPIGAPGIDAGGTLWVPVPSQGTVVPVGTGPTGQLAAGAAVPVGRPGDHLAVSIVGGTAAFTDSTSGTESVHPAHGAVLTVDLPGGVADPQGLLIPSDTEGPVLPLLNRPAAQLALVNVATGAPAAVGLGALAADDLGTPVEHAGRVYIPDQSAGTLAVFDESSGRMLDPITVTGKPGPLEVFTKDGVLFANAQDDSAAVTIDPSGTVHQVGKYDPALPGASPSSTSQPSSTPQSSPAAPPIVAPPSAPPSGSHGPKPPAASSPSVPLPSGARPSTPRSSAAPPPTTPTPVTTPTTPSTSASSSKGTPPPPTTPTSSSPAPPPPPGAPGSPRAQAQAGSIRVTFSPSPGTTPTSYTLTAPAGAQVSPSQIAPGGQYVFTVTGLPCKAGQKFSFIVQANYPGGSTPSQQTASVQPCLPPGAPQNVGLSVTGEHQVKASWSAPSSTGGGTVTYDVSWSGGASGSKSGTTQTSLAITVPNRVSTTVSVTAVNGAGQSTSPSASATPNGPTYSANLHNNSQYPVRLRPQPDPTPNPITQYPKGSTQPLTVYCQVQGTKYSDPTNPQVTYDIWDYVSDGSNKGYVGDLYVTTPSSDGNAFSDPPIWNCN
jgi:hypothetical protein